jgi:UDP-N-acetylmuramoyl-L-alanyl-D-glutamate--2,6-diaminopimelate ligase
MMALQVSTDGITLGDLLQGLVPEESVQNRLVTGMTLDSRHINAGDLFLACRGLSVDGAKFIDDAIAAGASAVLIDAASARETQNYPVPIIAVPELAEKAGLIASRFYDLPSASINVIGITGTNGKTSIAYFIVQSLNANSDENAGVVGTLGIGVPGKMQESANTTPDTITIHRAIADMRDQGMRNVVMEVSSHALDQARVVAVSFDIAIFSNLSQDHLDYHGDMQSYAEAKRQLFLKQSLHSAVINIDDDFGRQLAKEFATSLRVITYSTNADAIDEGSSEHVSGLVTCAELGALTIEVKSPWGEGTIVTRLSGEFNASNILACVSALCLSGLTFTDAIERISKLQAVPGRMECFSKAGNARVIVDYAHTPDALEKVLTSLRYASKGKLVCVFGCGGDRDKGKRALMGKIAETWSDHIILTNDNPRNEDAMSIIEQILTGIESKDKFSIIADRGLAIEQAIRLSSADDVVLIAGKGHESWQEIAGERSPFSDRILVRNLLEQAQ